MTTHGASPGLLRATWTGWVLFAGVVLLASALAHFIIGLLAVTRTAGMNLSSTPVLADYRSLGWSFLVVGVVLVATTAGVLRGRMWARALGIFLLVISALDNLALPAGVALSVLIIVLDVLGIYAIAAHGKEAKRALPQK